jgi:hypothetical protein
MNEDQNKQIKINNIKKIYYHTYLIFWSIFYIIFFGFNINYNKILTVKFIDYNMYEYLDIVNNQYLEKLTIYLQNYILINIITCYFISELSNNYYENLFVDIFDYVILEFGKKNSNVLKVFMIYQSFNWLLFVNILTYYKYLPKKVFLNYLKIREFKIILILILITKTNIYNYNYNTNYKNYLILNNLALIINIFCIFIVSFYFYSKFSIKYNIKNN